MNSLSITRVIHASVLINFNGYTILTDPWFSQLYGHYWGEPLGVSLGELPRLTGVVVSHKDYDHFDMPTFSPYPDKSVPFIMRQGIADIARQVGFANITELEPWETASMGPIQITATPARHKEDMGVFQNTYILEGEGFTVYFGGDTLLIPDFHEIARRFPHIDVALLPTNGLTIRPALYKRVVMNAEDAAQAYAILKPRVAIPIHYAYRGSWWRQLLIKYDRDPRNFVEAAQRIAPETSVKVLETGIMFTVPQLEPMPA